MNKRFARVLATCVLFVGVAFALPGIFAYGQSPNISINGERIEIPADIQQPVIINRRTFVPLHPVAEQLGFLVEWREHSQTALLSVPENTLKITLDRYSMRSMGELVSIDIAAQVINDQVMIPLRLISEAAGLCVRWNSDIFTVEITGNLPVRDLAPTIQREANRFSLDMNEEDLEYTLVQQGINFTRYPLSAWCDAFFYVTENGYMQFWFDDFGGLETIEIHYNLDIVTDRGIRIGDSREKIIELYGNNFRPAPHNPEFIEYFDGEVYLGFVFWDDILRWWSIGVVSGIEFLLQSDGF